MVDVPAVFFSFFNLFLGNVDVDFPYDVSKMQERRDAEYRLKETLFQDYNGDHPPPNSPVIGIPIMTVEHIHRMDQSRGTMVVTVTFVFTWRDDRLMWKPENYSGVKFFGKNRYEYLRYDIWAPVIHVTDMPGTLKQNDIFMSQETELIVESHGTVTAHTTAVFVMPCYFEFSTFPHDYQNCSVTMMSPYFADEFQFAEYGGVETAAYLVGHEKVIRVNDFELIDVDSQGYMMYLGLKVLDKNEKNMYPLRHLRSYFRYNLMLKRVNVLAAAQISLPMMVICVIIGISGIVPNHYSLFLLLFSIGMQFFYAIRVKEVLPDDFNGTPTLGGLALFIMLETVALIAWRTFSIFIRQTHYQQITLPSIEEEKVERERKRKIMVLDIVLSVDSVLKIVLLLQSLGNIYIIFKSA